MLGELSWGSLAVEAIGALTGAFAGFSLALWYDRRRLHQEKEEARKVVARSLLEEIQGNLLTLKIERAQLALLRIVSYSSAKTSGRLDVDEIIVSPRRVII